MTLRQGDTGDDVKLLQRILKSLGQLEHVDGQFGILTFAAVRRFQRASLLKDDGIVGPKTWTALLHAAPAEMPEPAVDPLVAAGEAAVAEALRYWKADIYDPRRSDKSPHADRSRGHINEMLKASGWTWEVPYLGDGQVEWCGIFAGACWRAAGLDPKWLATYWASTYRLDLWGRYRSFDAHHPNYKPSEGPHRLMAELNQHSTSLPFEPRAGDILIVGDGSPACGDHIGLVVSYDPVRKVFHTVEGNGNGVGPDGKRRQGVVRAERSLGGSGYCARRLIRIAPSDLHTP